MLAHRLEQHRIVLDDENSVLHGELMCKSYAVNTCNFVEKNERDRVTCGPPVSHARISESLDERPIAQLGERLLELRLRVHDDRPIPRDRFLDRLARHEQEPDPLFASLNNDLVAAVEEHEGTIAGRFVDAASELVRHAE